MLLLVLLNALDHPLCLVNTIVKILLWLDFNNGLIIQFCFCGTTKWGSKTIILPIGMSVVNYCVVTGFDNTDGSQGFRISLGQRTITSVEFARIGGTNTTGWFAVFGY